MKKSTKNRKRKYNKKLDERVIEDVEYLLRREETIKIKDIEYDGKFADMELGLFKVKDRVPSGEILRVYDPLYHILDDGKSYFKIKTKDGKEIAFYSSLNAIDFFELESKDYHGNYFIVTIKNVILDKKITLNMTLDQKERVCNYFNAINKINSLKDIEKSESAIKQHKMFNRLICKLLQKQNKYDEVIQYTGKRRDGIDIIAYIHKKPYSLKSVFKCQNNEIKEHHIDKIYEMVMEKNAVKGTIILTKRYGYKYKVGKRASELGIDIMEYREQIELLKENNLIYPLTFSEVIRETENTILAKWLEISEKKLISKERMCIGYEIELKEKLNKQTNAWIQWIEQGLIEKDEIEEIFRDMSSVIKIIFDLKQNKMSLENQISSFIKISKLTKEINPEIRQELKSYIDNNTEWFHNLERRISKHIKKELEILLRKNNII